MSLSISASTSGDSFCRAQAGKLESTPAHTQPATGMLLPTHLKEQIVVLPSARRGAAGRLAVQLAEPQLACESHKTVQCYLVTGMTRAGARRMDGESVAARGGVTRGGG